MNDKEWKQHQEKMRLRDETISSAKDTIRESFLASAAGFPYYITNPKALSLQVVAYFEQGIELGIKIGRGEL